MFYGLERLDKDTPSGSLGGLLRMSWKGTWRKLRTRNDGKRDSVKLTSLFNKVRVESVLGVLGSMPEYANMP